MRILDKLINTRNNIKTYGEGLPESWEELKKNARETSEESFNMLYQIYRLLVIIVAKNVETVANVPAYIHGGERSKIANKIISTLAPKRERRS